MEVYVKLLMNTLLRVKPYHQHSIISVGKFTYKMITNQNHLSKNDFKSSSRSIICEVIFKSKSFFGVKVNQNHF